MSRSQSGNLLGRAAVTAAREFRASLEPTTERTTAEKLEQFRALRTEQLRLARSWKNTPVIRDGHIAVARKLQADIRSLHAVELTSALEAVDESAEIQAAVQMFGGEQLDANPKLVEHTPRSRMLIDSGAVDANGNLKPYRIKDSHRCTPMTLEELGDDGQQYPY